VKRRKSLIKSFVASILFVIMMMCFFVVAFAETAPNDNTSNDGHVDEEPGYPRGNSVWCQQGEVLNSTTDRAVYIYYYGKNDEYITHFRYDANNALTSGDNSGTTEYFIREQGWIDGTKISYAVVYVPVAYVKRWIDDNEFYSKYGSSSTVMQLGDLDSRHDNWIYSNWFMEWTTEYNTSGCIKYNPSSPESAWWYYASSGKTWSKSDDESNIKVVNGRDYIYKIQDYKALCPFKPFYMTKHINLLGDNGESRERIAFYGLLGSRWWADTTTVGEGTGPMTTDYVLIGIRVDSTAPAYTVSPSSRGKKDTNVNSVTISVTDTGSGIEESCTTTGLYSWSDSSEYPGVWEDWGNTGTTAKENDNGNEIIRTKTSNAIPIKGKYLWILGSQDNVGISGNSGTDYFTRVINGQTYYVYGPYESPEVKVQTNHLVKHTYDDNYDLKWTTYDNVPYGSNYTPKAHDPLPYAYHVASIPAPFIVTDDYTDHKALTITYEPNHYLVTLNPNGGTVATTTYETIYGNVQGNIVDVPTREGYIFDGWYTEASAGTMVYNSNGICVNDGTYFSGYVWVGTRDLTVYAHWQNNQYTMTVNYRKWNPNTNAWDIYDTKTEKVDYGTTYSPAAGTAPTGYVFDSKTADYIVAADKTFNVDFKPKQTTVTYYRNYSSADTSTASQTFTYAKTGEALTDQSWSRTGYNILGWAVSRTATVADYSLTNPVSDEWKNTYYPSVSLYAVWQAQEYSITYDLAGGTASGNPASYTVETPTFTLNNPTRTYYRFDGWSGTGITGLSTSVTISKGSVGNRQYTAHWTDITPPTVMPSPASIQWCRNTNLTINWLDYGDGLADNTGRNYFYFMSADGTKTSNYAYTPDAASNVGADLNGTYYLYIHEIKDKEGNVSLLGGAKTGVYHKFGPYKFDNEDPTVSVTPKAADWCTEKSVTITVNDTGGSGLSASNAYQYYLSTSNTSPTGGTWTNYTSGTAFTIGTGLNGTYYLFVKKISDNAGNVSTGSSYHMYGPYKFDNTAPTVTVSPESADWCNSVNVTITVADAGGSGLSGSNSYQYYLSTSDSSLTGGSWTNYTSESAFTIGTGLNGTYYLYVKRVSDNAGNVSTTKGTAVTIEGTTYHRFGPHKFDNMAPEGTVTYYENNEMLGLWDNAHEPYGLMRIGDATDNLSGIREIYLYLYDEANPDNNTTLFFTGTGRNYELKFKLYTALADNRNVTKIHMAVYGVDEAGNVGELPITNYSFGFDGNEDPVKDEDIGFKKDEDGDGYIRDDFRIEARIVNVNGHQNFVSGGKAILEIYTFGYVEAVSAEFPSIRSQMRAEYDTEVNLVKTDIEVKEYNSCNHVFYIPLYCAESVYTDNLAWGYKKGMTQKRPVYITVDGSILKTIKTILK
jgi:uncharacterized repeat protein (TIGR02543 family)